MTEIAVSKPEVAFGINRNVFEWKPLNIRVVVDRITEDAKAELYFYHSNGSENPTLLHMGQANLLSSTMQRDFLKALTTRGLELDWQTILTYISRDTIEHLRQGEPVVDLTEEFGKQQPEYLLYPLFVKDAPNIIYADRSSAKSLFLVTIDLALSLPWYDNPIGLNIQESPNPHRVLYCDWESSATILGWQKECVRRGIKDAPPCDIPYLHCSGSLSDNIQHIQTKIEKLKTDVIIIDSLGMAVGDDLNLTKPAFAFYAALRQLPVTPIIIGHTSKNPESRRRTVYGNAYYENEARAVWEITKKQIPMSNELVITLFHRKPPPFAAVHEPIAFRYIFNGDTTLIEKADPTKDNEDAFKEPTQEEIIVGLLRDKETPLTPIEIANATGIQANSVRVALGRMVADKKISKNGDKYVI